MLGNKRVVIKYVELFPSLLPFTRFGQVGWNKIIPVK